MKSIFLLAFTIPLFFSCNSDSEPTNATDTSKPISFRNVGAYPANPDNRFDVSGALLYDITEAFVANNHPATNTADVIATVDHIAVANLDFMEIADTTYNAPSAASINTYLVADSWMLDNVINNLGLGNVARQELAQFSETLLQFEAQKQSYDVIYAYINNFEKAIQNNVGVGLAEQRIALNYSSIVRYGFYFAHRQKQKPRDRNWDISISCLVAALDGSKSGVAKGIVSTVAVSILINK